jgi:RNA polymerase sigma-70 factor (ECF subfamily)
LYEERFATFARVASAIAGDAAVGADLAQEAFVRAIQNRRGFRGEGPLEAWVWRIVVNVAHDARARSAERMVVAPEAAGPADVVDDYGVRRWVGELPERQRAAVFLRYFADLDYRAIALALGVEVGTVSATLSAAHQALRKSLGVVQ